MKDKGSPKWAPVPVPVVGMLHVPPLPGSPRYNGSWQTVASAVLRDAERLVEGGIHGLMLENYGDTPFLPARVPAYTATCMTRLAVEVRCRFDVPLGINVLRNDGLSALAIAMAVGASFVRVNVLCGARVTDQGVINGIAHELLRERALLRADEVEILADVNVKHSAPLARRPVEDEVTDCIARGGADAVIVSGSGTGKATDVAELRAVREAASQTPVFVGSGVTPQTLADYLPLADGFVVGTSLKQDGLPTCAVDPDRVARLMDAYHAERRAGA